MMVDRIRLTMLMFMSVVIITLGSATAQGQMSIDQAGCPGSWDDVLKVCTLTADSTQPLYFTESGTTLDCAGYAVSASSGPGAVYAYTLTDLSVVNCNIENTGGDGIMFYDVAGNPIIADNTFGAISQFPIDLNNCNHVEVAGNIVQGFASATSPAIRLWASGGCFVHDNVVEPLYGNRGIYLDGGAAENEISANSATTDRDGAYVGTSADNIGNIFSGNTFSGNTYVGINLAGGEITQLLNNTMENNGEAGVKLGVASVSTLLTGNRMCGNGYDLSDEGGTFDTSSDENTGDTINGRYDDAGTTGFTYSCEVQGLFGIIKERCGSGQYTPEGECSYEIVSTGELEVTTTVDDEENIITVDEELEMVDVEEVEVVIISVVETKKEQNATIVPIVDDDDPDDEEDVYAVIETKDGEGNTEERDEITFDDDLDADQGNAAGSIIEGSIGAKDNQKTIISLEDSVAVPGEKDLIADIETAALGAKDRVMLENSIIQGAIDGEKDLQVGITAGVIEAIGDQDAELLLEDSELIPGAKDLVADIETIELGMKDRLEFESAIVEGAKDGSKDFGKILTEGIVEAAGDQSAEIILEDSEEIPGEKDLVASVETVALGAKDRVEFNNQNAFGAKDREAALVVRAVVEAQLDQEMAFKDGPLSFIAEIGSKDLDGSLKEIDTIEFDPLSEDIAYDGKDFVGGILTAVIESEGYQQAMISWCAHCTDFLTGVTVDTVDEAGVVLHAAELTFDGSVVSGGKDRDALRMITEGAILADIDELSVLVEKDLVTEQVTAQYTAIDDLIEVSGGKDGSLGLDASIFTPLTPDDQVPEIELMTVATQVAFESSLMEDSSEVTLMKMEEIVEGNKDYVVDMSVVSGGKDSEARFDAGLVLASMTPDDFKAAMRMVFNEAYVVQEMDLIASADTTSIAQVIISVNGDTLTIDGSDDIQLVVEAVAEALEPYSQTSMLKVFCGVRRFFPFLVDACSESTEVKLYAKSCAQEYSYDPEIVSQHCPVIVYSNEQVHSGFLFAHYNIEVPYGKYVVFSSDPLYTDENGNPIYSKKKIVRIPNRKRVRSIILLPMELPF